MPQVFAVPTYIAVLSFRRAATIRPERKRIDIDYYRRNWTACVLRGEGGVFSATRNSPRWGRTKINAIVPIARYDCG